MQVCINHSPTNQRLTSTSPIPKGATLLGTVLSSNKTTIYAMTSNCTAHPFLISLANLHMDFKNKASNHAFMLLELLPIPKFLMKDCEIRGVLENCLIHTCLDFILKPLKEAAAVGVIMSNPWHGQQFCYTPLTGYIMDHMEVVVIAAVCRKTSPVSTATYKEFGNPFPHPP